MPDSDCGNLTLVTGGARSGKSSFAEHLVIKQKTKVAYLATMEEVLSDSEVVERIRKHRQRRPNDWLTVEKRTNIEQAIEQLPPEVRICLIDCLSLAVSNIVLDAYAGNSPREQVEQDTLHSARRILAAIAAKPEVRFVVVTNEVGWGIVADNEIARVYSDLLGMINQLFAGAAQEVWLSCAGLQIKLKPQYER